MCKEKEHLGWLRILIKTDNWKISAVYDSREGDISVFISFERAAKANSRHVKFSRRANKRNRRGFLAKFHF